MKRSGKKWILIKNFCGQKWGKFFQSLMKLSFSLDFSRKFKGELKMEDDKSWNATIHVVHGMVKGKGGEEKKILHFQGKQNGMMRNDDLFKCQLEEKMNIENDKIDLSFPVCNVIIIFCFFPDIYYITHWNVSNLNIFSQSYKFSKIQPFPFSFITLSLQTQKQLNKNFGQCFHHERSK